jgi:hypothetical protein
MELDSRLRGNDGEYPRLVALYKSSQNPKLVCSFLMHLSVDYISDY